MKQILLVITAALLASAPTRADVPQRIPHQGRVTADGDNFNGTGQFAFLLFFDPDTDHANGNESPLWSNATTSPTDLSEPGTAVSIDVTKGLYSVSFGDTTTPGMAALPESIEPPGGETLYLRIWFDDGSNGPQQLAPDQLLASAPFALHARKVADGGVTGSSLADGAVTTAKLADGAVTQEKLAAGAASSLAIQGDAEKVRALVRGDGAVAIGSDPATIQPPTIGSLTRLEFFFAGWPTDMTVEGDYLYFVDNFLSRLQIVDVSSPENMTPRGSYTFPNHSPGQVAVRGGFAYVVATGNVITPSELQILDISDPDNIVFRNSISTNLDLPAALDVEGNYVYVVDRNTDLLQIFDVTDPDNPVARDFEGTNPSVPVDLEVEGNFAYVLDALGLHVFDVSDPDDIVARGSDNTNIVTPEALTVRGRYAYVVATGSGGMQIFDIANPDNVTPRGFRATELGFPRSIALDGDFAFLVDGNLQVYDISDPDGIVFHDSDSADLTIPLLVAAKPGVAFVADQTSRRLWAYRTTPALNVSDFAVTGRSHFGGDLKIAGTITAVSDSDPLLTLRAGSPTGKNSGLEIIGARNGATNADTAFLDLSNFDSNEQLGTFYTMARISGGMNDVSGGTGYLRFYTNDGSSLREAMRIDKNGNVGIGTISPSSPLEVRADGEGVAKFRRNTSDGELVVFQRDQTISGNITVASGVVSYNAFTGSHYANCKGEPSPGTLMRMTGRNRPLHQAGPGEIVYGVEPTAQANDPACLGSYVGSADLTAEDQATDGVRLVAAVGNGELWVVDTGRDIEPGDLLVSSDAPGCAMRDDPARFPIGHIVARAAKPVRWEDVPAEGKRVRRAKISVLFDPFTRSDTSALQARVRVLEQEKDNLESRLSRIEALLSAQASADTP